MNEPSILQGGKRKSGRSESDGGLHKRTETGFPSPATDHLESSLDLESLLVHHPAATFYIRAEGSGMEASGIHDGDILVTDRSLNCSDGCIVVAVVQGETVVRRIAERNNAYYLLADSPAIPPVAMNNRSGQLLWGVVTHVIHKCLPGRKNSGSR